MANKWSGTYTVVSMTLISLLCTSYVSTEMVGGHIYWKQIVNKKINIMYRLQWEGGSETQDYTGGKGRKRLEGDIYICDHKTSNKIALLTFKNLNYNPYRKWTVGQGSVKVSLKSKEFQFYLAHTCMSPFRRLKEPDISKWSLYVSGNLTSSSANQSPVSYMNPIIPNRPACQKNIKIPIHDNGHEIECRWPSIQHGECVPNNDRFSNVLPSCETPKGVKLSNCKLKFDGAHKGSHLLTIMIEAQQDGQVQSKVPVQFIVEVIQTESSFCESEPLFDTDERPCVYNAKAGHLYKEDMLMKAMRSESLIEVESIMPTGMKVSESSTLDEDGRHAYKLTFKWPARYVTHGVHLVCFVTTRSDGFMSRQECFEINVISGDVDNGTFSIVSPTKQNNYNLRLDFNYPVTLPSEKKHIMVAIAEVHKNVHSTLFSIAPHFFSGQYNKLNKKTTHLYDFAKSSTPVSVSDKNSLTLKLHGTLGKRVASKKSKFIVLFNFKDLTSVMNNPCKSVFSSLANTAFIGSCVFDLKSTKCAQPK